MNVRNFEDGKTIVEEGTAGNEFFIIQRGACDCFKKLLKL
jgi:CRP-like cAMP-binding protein